MARNSKLYMMFSLSILCVSLFSFGNAQQKQRKAYADNVALVVDTEVVTRREWNSALAQAQAEMRGIPASMRLSGEALKEEVIKQLAINKILGKVAQNVGIQISDLQVDQAIADIASRNRASVAQLKQYLTAEGVSYDNFRENIRKQMMMVELRNGLMSNVRVTKDEVAVYMRSNEFAQVKNELMKQKRPNAKVQHILVRVNNDISEKEARLRIDRLRERLASGESFEEIASAQSQDPVSAAKGGDLGWVSPGQLVPEFEKVMLSLPIGQISQPVRTPFGYHIIKVNDRKTGIVDEAQLENIARDFYYRKKAAQQYGIWQDKMLADVYIDRRI